MYTYSRMAFRRKPARRTVRRPKRRFQRKGKFFKSADRKGHTMINRTPARQQNVIAPVFYTRVNSDVLGVVQNTMVIPTTNPGVNAISFSVSGNVLPFPWNKGNGSSSVQGSYDDMLPVATAGNLILANSLDTSYALQPMGYTNVLKAMYNQFRVLAAKLRITIVPSVQFSTTLYDEPLYSTKVFTLCVYPYRDVVQLITKLLH